MINLGTQTREAVLKAKKEKYTCPLFAVSMPSVSDRRPSRLEQGYPYSNRGPLQSRPSQQQQQQQQQQPKPQVMERTITSSRPPSEKQYNYNNKSGKLERTY